MKKWLILIGGVLIVLFILTPRWMLYIKMTSQKLLVNRTLQRAEKKIANALQLPEDNNVGGPITSPPPNVPL